MKYKLTSQQIASNVGGEIVILNHNKGEYYGLDEVGALVWNSLEEEPQTLDSLCSAVLEDYDIDKQTCLEDIELLLKDLISEKLVELTE
ncbi:Coenzyme PQQ synthesis protein D (PqqD) [Dyadobacter koreensis]|uniref:Coenzyme PQQ synthesis protein D (PqqD) n=1 Tax=Dyadobacter koreensis TaxID=408657 RepID=A0A1H6TAI6_9BACT|nr:PqqD family protein [Dyadobacter koreensis]SEI77011.1 Coenzyme PQQ synthesis protein D (PqqD) [Dyadobacter koreensis]